MKKLVFALYSAFAYGFFLVTFLYAIGFVQGVFVPKSIDSGVPGDPPVSAAINLALLTLFATQHSVMARPAFKQFWLRIVPGEAERSTYVLAASAALAALFVYWRPMPQLVWVAESGVTAASLHLLSWAGWGLVLASTFLINHFHLFGLSQGFARLLRLPSTEARFETPSLYRFVRHPIYAGFVIAFWAAPQMSAGRLLFAVAATAYILVGIQLEERDLIAQFGERYRHYRRHVGMLLPALRIRSVRDAASLD
jgi:methanethiol S-methyltransferase